jgi:hypothetical protein
MPVWLLSYLPETLPKLASWGIPTVVLTRDELLLFLDCSTRPPPIRSADLSLEKL